MPLRVSDAFLSDPPNCFDLEPGDVLLLATDGFFEWEGANGERFGTDRLAASLRAARSKPATKIISSWYQDVLRFAGGRGRWTI